MVYILQIFFIILLLLRWKGGNNCYKILVSFQLFSFVLAPFVANFVLFETPLTFFNCVFCLINLFLITVPWSKAKFETIEIKNIVFFNFYKKILYTILGYTFINNFIVLIIVRLYLSDIAVFKAQKGFIALYETIPFFGILFRYSSVSSCFGLLALPICAYYISNQSFKEAAKAFLLSSSTLIASLAFYSRARILCYIMLCVCLFFYVEHIFDNKTNIIARKILKYIAVVVVLFFTSITFSRFSSSVMSYYVDRIPNDSYIKNPILYNVFDYASVGFPNGIMQLEVHEIKDVMKGEPLVYDLKMMLSYFHFISWDKEEYSQRLNNAYNKLGINDGNNSGSFHGYTCRMVKTMGYIFTLFFDVLYYRYVRRRSFGRTMNIKSLTILTFLLMASISSIFYNDYAGALFPLLFYLIISITYNLIYHRIRISRQWKV